MSPEPEPAEPCTCTLCRERAGLPVVKMVIEYEQPKNRKRGEPCDCRHCTALRAEIQ
jgi:hypothetical protein